VRSSPTKATVTGHLLSAKKKEGAINVVRRRTFAKEPSGRACLRRFRGESDRITMQGKLLVFASPLKKGNYTPPAVAAANPARGSYYLLPELTARFRDRTAETIIAA
jgi:hypothetical protein